MKTYDQLIKETQMLLDSYMSKNKHLTPRNCATIYRVKLR